MFSGFFWPKTVPARIEKCEELKQPLLLLASLRYKEVELKKSADINGPSSIDYAKHFIISNLLKQVDKTIAVFNENKKESKVNDTGEIVKLVKELSEIINVTYKTNSAILKKPRNKQRETVSNVIYYGTFGTTLLIGSALSLSTIGKLATFLYVAPLVSTKVGEVTGISDITPRSVRILDALADTLDKIKINLTKNLTTDKNDERNTLAEYFECPILGERMIDPVFCLLDNRSYERSAIEEWLGKYDRRSPLSRIKMREDQVLDDVLKPNIDYRELINKINQMDLEHIDENKPPRGP